MGEIGRLNRETNPPPGEEPGFKPQHKLLDGSFADTGEADPLPTNDSTAHQRLTAMETKLDTMNTELTAIKQLLSSFIG